MKIGIDFDNTIAQYDNLFIQISLVEGIIDKNFKGQTKNELKNYLLNLPNGEIKWMNLQGLIYGKYMHQAKLMPGVANFLLQCKLREYEVFIVSHKTKFGHFDLEKIPLREEALKWMEYKEFFNPRYFGIEKKNIYFANTRKEKVEKISELDCISFIDDLPEVFKEPHFPKKTDRILFNKLPSLTFKNKINIIGNWNDISNHIFGEVLLDDIVCWVQSFMNLKDVKPAKISGRGNSQIYKFSTSENIEYAVKFYPDRTLDNLNRLMIEFSAIDLLNNNGFKNIPKAVNKNNDLNIGVYSWIKGSNVKAINQRCLKQVISFVKSLHQLSKINSLPFTNLAVGSCLSGRDVVQQIEFRLNRFQSIANQSLNLFLDKIFIPLWEIVKREFFFIWPEQSRDYALDKKYQILSPSDFGFHNAIQGNNEMLTFIDFEYFGWDDPVKLTADFIWHPGMSMSSKLIGNWKDAMLDLFSNDPDFVNRFNAAMPLYGMRWAMIILNEFLPGFAERRKNAGETDSYDLEKSQSIQLMKAKQYCKRVEKLFPHLMIS